LSTITQMLVGASIDCADRSKEDDTDGVGDGAGLGAVVRIAGARVACAGADGTGVPQPASTTARPTATRPAAVRDDQRTPAA
jgi:hypothetical protein